MDELPITDGVAEIIHLACQKATRLHHAEVNSGHLLLGLIEEGQGAAVYVLKNLNVDLDRLRREVENRLLNCETADTAVGQPSLSIDAKKPFRYASEAACYLGHDLVGSEHLLLGLLCVRRGIAVRALRKAGANYAAVWDEVCRVLGVSAVRRKRPRSMSSYDFGSPVKRFIAGLLFLLMALTLGEFAVAIVVMLANGPLPAAPWKAGLMHILPELLAVAAILMLILAVLAWTGGSRGAESLLRMIIPEATVAIFALFLTIFFLAAVRMPAMVVVFAIEAVAIILFVIVLRIRKHRQMRRNRVD
jgi:hypothetical protein